MTLTAVELDRLLNSHTRECRVRLWLFDGFDIDTGGAIIGGAGQDDLAAQQKPIPLVSPPYSLLKPGESVTLYGGDSFVRGGGPASGHAWSLVSGSATLAPSGNTCVVTPLVPDEVVQVRLTVSASNGETAYRNAYTVASVNGWAQPVGEMQLTGAYDAGGWSGQVTVAGNSATVADLALNKLMLVHIDTTYDGEEVTMGGYRRANNLALLRVVDWQYTENHTTGRTETTIQLGSPISELERTEVYVAASEWDGHERGLYFEHASPSGGATGADVLRRIDFRLTDAILWIAAETNAVRHYNFTVFHDSVEFGTDGYFFLPVDDIWTLLKSTVESVAGLIFVNYMGNVQCIPSPSVRADEWWGTPDLRLDETNPLTADYLLDYGIHYREQPVQRLTMKGFDSGNLPIAATIYVSPYDDYSGDQSALVLEGYIVGDEITLAGWARDFIAMHNREWDATIRLACTGNVFNVGDFVYVDLEPSQPGHTSAVGRAYVNGIEHTINNDTGMQVTTASLVQVTQWDGVVV